MYSGSKSCAVVGVRAVDAHTGCTERVRVVVEVGETSRRDR